MLWHELRNVKNNELNQMVADVCVPADSPWFDGHFPDEPVLPGIAQLGLIVDAISRCSETTIEVESLDRIRFKKLIRPGDALKLSVAPQKEKPKVFAFRIRLEDELVCSGLLTVK